MKRRGNVEDLFPEEFGPISEAGVYLLYLDAWRDFGQQSFDLLIWLAREVLPAIRARGSYQLPPGKRFPVDGIESVIQKEKRLT